MTPIEKLGALGTIPVHVEVALDCGALPLERILSLQEGSVVPSRRAAGDNVDLHIGGKLIGYGEIVALEGVMGVRITHLKETS